MSGKRVVEGYDAALALLLDRVNFERFNAAAYSATEFKLDRMRELLSRLGQPHQDMRIVHVAGTKGKGSVSAMTAAVLSAAGYRTGLFTSPHLEQIEERFRVDSALCSAEEFVQCVEMIRPAIEAMDHESASQAGEMSPTYFEFTTALAFVHFRNRRVDAAVLEVGLGGRLDSTNVCVPEVSVITQISFDHMKLLGNTLGKIATEKAGILKPGVPLVSGVVEEEPRRAILARADELACPRVELGQDFDFDYFPPHSLEEEIRRAQMSFRGQVFQQRVQYDQLELNLIGQHQAANASVALATLATLESRGWRIPESAVRTGLAEVQWPARFEIASRRPTVVLDAAHNVSSVEALLKTLDESFPPGRRWLIFGTTLEKEAEAMLERLLPRFQTTLLTQYQENPRGYPLKELALLAKQKGTENVEIHSHPMDCWKSLRPRLGPNDLVCVTGSFFLITEFRRVWEEELLEPAGVSIDSAKLD